MFTMLLESSAASTQQPGTAGSLTMTVLMLIFWIAVMYLILIRPQKKQQKEMDAIRDSVEAGDSIMTTSYFYGVVIDVVDDTVIVEFGNDRHCRIPMNKNAILEVDKNEKEDTKE